MLGQFLFANLPRPASHLAVGKQRETTKIASPARMLQITQNVIETQTRTDRTRVHAAVQHTAYRRCVLGVQPHLE
jgi:hypothetical protein